MRNNQCIQVFKQKLPQQVHKKLNKFIHGSDHPLRVNLKYKQLKIDMNKRYVIYHKNNIYNNINNCGIKLNLQPTMIEMVSSRNKKRDINRNATNMIHKSTLTMQKYILTIVKLYSHCNIFA